MFRRGDRVVLRSAGIAGFITSVERVSTTDECLYRFEASDPRHQALHGGGYYGFQFRLRGEEDGMTAAVQTMELLAGHDREYQVDAAPISVWRSGADHVPQNYSGSSYVPRIPSGARVEVVDADGEYSITRTGSQGTVVGPARDYPDRVDVLFHVLPYEHQYRLSTPSPLDRTWPIRVSHLRVIGPIPGHKPPDPVRQGTVGRLKYKVYDIA